MSHPLFNVRELFIKSRSEILGDTYITPERRKFLSVFFDAVSAETLSFVDNITYEDFSYRDNRFFVDQQFHTGLLPRVGSSYRFVQSRETTTLKLGYKIEIKIRKYNLRNYRCHVMPAPRVKTWIGMFTSPYTNITFVWCENGKYHKYYEQHFIIRSKPKICSLCDILNITCDHPLDQDRSYHDMIKNNLTVKSEHVPETCLS